MVTLHYQQKPDVHLRQMDDQFFLADIDTDTVFHLNSIGSAVWRLLEDPISIDETVNLLVDAFPETEASRIMTDVYALFEKLSSHGLIVATDGS